MTEDERDRKVADAINRGECPFGHLEPGQTIAHCPLGFPGCGCGDEIELNPYLQSMRDEIDKSYEQYCTNERELPDGAD